MKSSAIVVDESVELVCAPYIFDAPKAFESRDEIKLKTKWVIVILVSLVVSSNNLQGVDGHSGGESEEKPSAS